MLLKKYILIPLVATPIVAVGVIVPAIVVANKNVANNAISDGNINNGNGNSNNNVNGSHVETKEIENQLASNYPDLKGKTVDQIMQFFKNPLFGKSWVIQNRDKLFTGSIDLLTTSAQINQFHVMPGPTNNAVTLLVELKAGSYYDSAGQPSTAPKACKFVILI